MKAFDENEVILKKLEKLVKDIIKLDSNFDIDTDKSQNDIYSKTIYSANNLINRLLQRFTAINSNLIIKVDTLKSWEEFIENKLVSVCGIRYMDSSLNCGDYYTQSFYNMLYEKYKERPANLLILGISRVFNNRILNIEHLELNDRKKAEILDQHLNLCHQKELAELLIDFIKCIQYNYLSPNEEVTDSCTSN